MRKRKQMDSETEALRESRLRLVRAELDLARMHLKSAALALDAGDGNAALQERQKALGAYDFAGRVLRSLAEAAEPAGLEADYDAVGAEIRAFRFISDR